MLGVNLVWASLSSCRPLSVQTIQRAEELSSAGWSATLR